MAQTITAEQGTQPRFGDVLVGIMRCGGDGTRKATRLAIRSPRGEDITVIEEGGSIDLHGTGLLTVEQITLAEADKRATVQLQFQENPPDTQSPS